MYDINYFYYYNCIATIKGNMNILAIVKVVRHKRNVTFSLKLTTQLFMRHINLKIKEFR